MRVLGNVLKSQSDNRLYKAIKLKNDIECLIISDKQAKRSSAALSVGVGSLRDPVEAQGLAHYLEHMLFMGTKKYPNQNDYSTFISKNFGHSNAYTSQEETNYHFQVASNAFVDTLDRFAQFFISPLMSDSSSQRQLNAVHSQHCKNILNDSWRKYQLTKFLAKKGHPYSKFSTGNKESLSNPNLREMLHNFYNSQYSSNLMKLVVCGNQSPQQMSKIVQEKFSEVPNKQYQRFQMSQTPYSQDFYRKMYKIFPVQDRKVLQLSWTLSNKAKYYENPPSAYLSYVLGHQGKGSLLSFLISQGLANGLSAGGSDTFNCFSEFQIKVSLTKKGVENVKQILGYILYFINVLKSEEPQKWVFEQLQKVNKMKFDYLQKKQGMSFTSGLAKRLQDHSIQQVLSYPYFMKQWRPDLIKDYLNELARDNMCIFLQAKQVERQCNLTEPIYQTKFAINDFSILQPRICPATFPPRNPFIPTDFQTLQMGRQKVPSLLHKSDQHEVYYKKDHKFNLPKIMVNSRFYCKGDDTVKEYLSRKIFIDMLNQKMRQFVYLGDSAETFGRSDFDSYFSVDVSFSGFRDSTLKFVKPYLQQVFQFEPTDRKYFETVKENFQRSLANYFLGDPYRLAYASTVLATRQGSSLSQTQKQKQIKNITFEDVLSFSKKWSKQLFVETLITGNLDENQAKQVVSSIDEIASKSTTLPKGQIGSIRAINIPPHYIWAIQQKLTNKSEQNSSVLVHFQHQSSTLRSKILQDLCYNFIKEPAFDYLRTKEQLGYIVMCLPDENRGVLGMSILLQSAIKTSYQIVEYVDIFLNNILKQKIKQLDEKTFEEFKKSLKVSKMEQDKTLGSETSRFWVQIVKHTFTFDRKQKQLQEINTISLQQFKNFVNLIFYINPKRLEIHMTSQNEQDKNVSFRNRRIQNNKNFRLLPDAESLKKKMGLYQDFYSHL